MISTQFGRLFLFHAIHSFDSIRARIHAVDVVHQRVVYVPVRRTLTQHSVAYASSVNIHKCSCLTYDIITVITNFIASAVRAESLFFFLFNFLPSFASCTISLLFSPIPSQFRLLFSSFGSHESHTGVCAPVCNFHVFSYIFFVIVYIRSFARSLVTFNAHSVGNHMVM